MYKALHIDRKMLNLFVICGSVFVSSSHISYASNSSPGSAPLQVYIPNPSTFISRFSTDKMEYNTDENIFSAKGNVEVHQDKNVLKADLIEYDQRKNRLRALGNVTILSPNGKVAFFDKLELKNGIKEAIINKLKAQMIDNDTFMAAEERKPSGHMVNYAASDRKKSLVDKMFTYLNPDFLTASNTEDDAERLASLAPAAGDNVATLDNNPVIGNIPLIELPDGKTPATKQAEPTTPVSIATASVATKETGSGAEQAKLANVPPPIPAITPLISLPEEASKEVEKKKNDEQKAIENIITKGTAEETIKKSEENSEKEAEVKPAAKTEENKSVKKENNPQKNADTSNTKKPESTEKIKEKEVAVEKPAEKLAVEQSSSEPEESLSPKSRELLSKIKLPAKPGKDNSTNPFKIERSHDMQDLFKGNESAVSGASEALGVKVDKKMPYQVNTDYELEKAYSATISGQNEAAIATYQGILDNSPNNTQALFGLATLYHRARQLDKARHLYGRLLSIDPDHRDGFNNFLVLLADEAPREALGEMEKLEAKNPGFSTIPAQIAVIYQKLGDYDKATDKMFRAVALSPENLTYRYNLAIMLDKQKNYDEATKLYKQLVEASDRGEKIPGNISNIQQRLTFISSNRP